MCGDSPRDRPPKKSPTNSSFWRVFILSKVLLSLSFSLFRSLASLLLFILPTPSPNYSRHSLTQYSLFFLHPSHGASESRFFSCASMVVEPNSSNSGMADVPSKASLPRKSAFSCEACRKRKVSGSHMYIYIYTPYRKREVAHIGWIPIRREDHEGDQDDRDFTTIH